MHAVQREDEDACERCACPWRNLRRGILRRFGGGRERTGGDLCGVGSGAGGVVACGSGGRRRREGHGRRMIFWDWPRFAADDVCCGSGYRLEVTLTLTRVILCHGSHCIDVTHGWWVVAWVGDLCEVKVKRFGDLRIEACSSPPIALDKSQYNAAYIFGALDQ